VIHEYSVDRDALIDVRILSLSNDSSSQWMNIKPIYTFQTLRDWQVCSSLHYRMLILPFPTTPPPLEKCLLCKEYFSPCHFESCPRILFLRIKRHQALVLLLSHFISSIPGSIVTLNDCAMAKYSPEVEKYRESVSEIFVSIPDYHHPPSPKEIELLGSSRKIPVLSFSIEMFVENCHSPVPKDKLIELGPASLAEERMKERWKEHLLVIPFGVCSSGELGPKALTCINFLCEISRRKKSPLSFAPLVQHLSLIIETSRGIMLNHYLQALSSSETPPSLLPQTVFPLPPPYDSSRSPYSRYKYRKRYFSMLVKLLSSVTLYPSSKPNLLLPLSLIPKPIPEIITTHEKNLLLEYNHAIEQEEGLFSFLSNFSVPAPPPDPFGLVPSAPIEISDPTLEFEIE
jgi:hypothetical protein